MTHYIICDTTIWAGTTYQLCHDVWRISNNNTTPDMKNMSMDYKWMVVGMATCTCCGNISYDIAMHNAIMVDLNSIKLIPCEKCAAERTCVHCTHIHEFKLYEFGYSCPSSCDYRCYECGVDLD